MSERTMNEHAPADALSALLDGVLPHAERREVEAHLAGCEPCRARLTELERTMLLVRALEPVQAPPGIRATVRARLAETRRRRILPALALSWRTAGAAVAVLLVGLFAVNLVQQMRPSAPEATVQQDAPAAAPAPEPLTPGSGESGGFQRASAPTPQFSRVRAPAGTREFIEPQVVRTARLTVEVRDLESGAQRLGRITQDAGGFIARSSTSKDEAAPSGTFVLRVPARRFTAVLEQVGALGDVKQREVQGEEVTEEVVDLRARLRNLERHEQRLLSVMSRASRVPDLLSIEQELSRVRGEIEQLTGRLRFLADRVEFGTVEVTLRQKTQSAPPHFWDPGATVDKVRAAFLGSIRQVLAGAEAALVALAALAPLALLVAGGWFVVRRVLRPA